MKTIEEIEAIICTVRKILPSELHLVGPGKGSETNCLARHIIIYFAYNQFDSASKKRIYKLQQIADYYGQSHPNMMHALKHINNDIAYNKSFASYMKELTDMIEYTSAENKVTILKGRISKIKDDISDLVVMIRQLQSELMSINV